MDKPDRLEWEVARTLAQVHMLATRTHWRLVLEKLEEPMVAWERGAGADATEEEHRLKVDELEAAHLAAHNAQVAKIIAGWGAGQPPR